MNGTIYTPELAAEGERVYSAIESVPKEDRAVVSMMVEALINGLKAHKMISQPTAERPGV